MNHLDCSINGDPNNNYTILESLLTTALDKVIPLKKRLNIINIKLKNLVGSHMVLSNQLSFEIIYTNHYNNFTKHRNVQGQK